MRARLLSAYGVRYAPVAVAAAVAVFALVYVLFASNSPVVFGEGDWLTTRYGSALDDPKDFYLTVLNALTLAGLYFIVASGFTLIFGLMRVVNMAHGALFLFGGYIGLELQRYFVGVNPAFGLTSDQVDFANWFFPLLVAAVCIGVLGLVIQQGFLRWNQGQDLRQALITIALAIILADQLNGYWPLPTDTSFPGVLDKFVNAGVQYNLARLVIVGIAIGVGVALWLWLKKTRTGMVIRAGVDDRAMVSALGINIQLTFAIAFFVGSALAGLGGMIEGSIAGLTIGVTDAQFLLNALVVVIIGGMGSLGGAAVGALLFGFIDVFSAVYLPTISANCCTQYQSILTFALLAAVLALRPLGLFGRPA